LASCGDGYHWSEEYCEDGNLDGLDSCNAHCAAPGTLRWTRLFADESGPIDAAFDPDGSLYVGNDGWLARYDHDSEENLWTTAYPGGIKMVAWHPDGLVITVRRIGAISSIAAYDAEDGDELWSDEIGSAPQLRAYALAVDGLGSIVMARTMANADPSFSDAWVTSWDAGGDQQWSQPTAEHSYAGNPQIAADELGNIFVSHSVTGHVLLARFDASGQLIWEELTPQAEEPPVPTALAAANGRLAVAGWAYTLGDDDNPTHPDVWVELRDISGEALWSRVHDGSADDWLEDLEYAVDVEIDAGGNVAVLGVTQEGDEVGEGVWLGRYNELGDGLWERTMADEVSRFPYAVAIAGDGDLVATMSSHTNEFDFANGLYSFAP
jgi:cysteine-rich repeat protein